MAINISYSITIYKHCAHDLDALNNALFNSIQFSLSEYQIVYAL
jgi:hypothetical protein